MPKKDVIPEIRAMLKKKPKSKPELLSTGSTLLNLTCSGRVSGGLQKGCYYLLVGDSSSGKSFLSLTCFAEAALNSSFANYRFIHDDVENGSLMDRERYFGKAASRIEAPKYKDGEPVYSGTIEEFYFNIDTALKAGKPIIYVLDSMDSLDTEDEQDQFAKEKSANGKKVTGSYGTAKAKKNSSYLRVVTNELKRTGSILIIISQTRDNIGYGAQYNPKTRSGGKSLRFYATVEMWTSIGEKITKNVNGKNRKIGIVSKIQIKKNRIQGREPVVEVDILDESGIDDLGSCVRFLVDEGHWKESKGVITAHDLELSGRRETLIKKIEDGNLEKDVRSIVAETWQRIEEGCRLDRKRRY